MTVEPSDEAVRSATSDSVTYAFGDAGAGLFGLARLGLSPGEDGQPQGSALALLFAAGKPAAVLARGGLAVDEGTDWARAAFGGLRTEVAGPLERWTVALEGDDGDGFALEFTALGPAVASARLGGVRGYEQPCAVRGSVRVGGRERAVSALGQRGHAWGDLDWEGVGLARTVTAWTEAGCVALSAIRPRVAEAHGEEETWAALWEPERGAVAIEQGRLSTTYDAEGRTRRAGFELWPVGGQEELTRRGAGEVLCGSTLDLGALRLDCAFLRWHFEGATGVGRYDIVRRAG